MAFGQCPPQPNTLETSRTPPPPRPVEHIQEENPCRVDSCWMGYVMFHKIANFLNLNDELTQHKTRLNLNVHHTLLRLYFLQGRQQSSFLNILLQPVLKIRSRYRSGCMPTPFWVPYDTNWQHYHSLSYLTGEERTHQILCFSVSL